MIIDTHAHIDHLKDPLDALAQADAADVSDVVAVSVDLKSCRANLELSQQSESPKVHLALGIHPGNIVAEELDETYQFIREHIAFAKAVGETGLDYTYKGVRENVDEQAQQRQNFQWHIDLAQEFNLPLIVHSRGAESDCLEMTKASGLKKVLFHWYSGPVDVMEKVLMQGFYVSTSPSVGYSGYSRKAMSAAPVERILIETDTPVRYKDGDDHYTAQPKDVWRTLDALAELKNVDREELLEIVNRNARTFFGI